MTPATTTPLSAIPTRGGKSGSSEAAPPSIEWKGIGVVYCRETDPPEFRVIYLSSVAREVKDLVAERFGAGSLEWNTCR
jgi:hypothetical protein